MDISDFTPEEAVIFSNPKLITEELKKSGVQGLLILDNSGICLLIRDFNKKGLYLIDNAQLFTGFISAVNMYSDSINGYLTDIGLGGTRLIIKKTHNFIFCLFLDEILHQENLGKDFLLLTETALLNLVKTFEIYVSLMKQENEFYDQDVLEQFHFQADLTLLQSLLQGRKLLSVLKFKK